MTDTWWCYAKVLCNIQVTQLILWCGIVGYIISITTLIIHINRHWFMHNNICDLLHRWWPQCSRFEMIDALWEICWLSQCTSFETIDAFWEICWPSQCTSFETIDALWEICWLSQCTSFETIDALWEICWLSQCISFEMIDAFWDICWLSQCTSFETIDAFWEICWLSMMKWVVQHTITNWSQSDLRFCKNEGSKRSKINKKGDQLDRKSRRKLIQKA